MAKSKARKDGGAVYNDENGKPVFEDDVISDILSKLEKSKTERGGVELQWQLNARFLAGDQYCAMNPGIKKIIELAPANDYLERETFNLILPLTETRIANLKKLSFNMNVRPRTDEADDYEKARLATKVLRYVQDSTDFESRMNTALYWSEVCGCCFWLSWWDSAKGEEYARIEGKDGNSRTVHQGDINYGLLSPYEVYPENILKQGIDSQRYIILEQVKTVQDVYDLYGIRLEGGRVNTFCLTPVNSGNGWGHDNTVLSYAGAEVDDAVRLITYFERPSRSAPDGRMVIMTADRLIYYGELPYKSIPVVQQLCREMPGQFFGRSVIEDLIPRQRAYNGCKNRIHEYLKRTALNSYWVEEGSVDIDDYEERGAEPGALLVYSRGQSIPTPVHNAQLPGELIAEMHNLKADMEYVAGTSQLMVNGATPSGVTSGTAISNLMEIDSTRLAVTGDNVRAAVRRLAVIWLEIYKKYANTRRIINIAGMNDIGMAVMWSGSDITSFDIGFMTENELVVSKSAQQENFIRAYQLGLYTDSSGVVPEHIKMKAIELMETGENADMLTLDSLDRKAAEREAVFFETHRIIPRLSEFDDHSIHIDEHKRFIKQMSFAMIKMKAPELAAQFEAHIREHTEAISEPEEEAQ